LLDTIYKNDLNELRQLVTLRLERCKISHFSPFELHSKLKHLSLRQNEIKNLNEIVFGKDEGNYKLEEVQHLVSVDLSSNKFD